MRHIEKALNKFRQHKAEAGDESVCQFINIENIEDTVGVAPVVSFTIQSDPVSMVGVNGVQAEDLILYAKCLLESLNEAFPCEENVRSLKGLEFALYYQKERTNRRMREGIEGMNLENPFVNVPSPPWDRDLLFGKQSERPVTLGDAHTPETV